MDPDFSHLYNAYPDYGDNWGLLSQLQHFDRFGCRDARDRIYALLGLHHEHDFQPDYSKSVREVYLAFAEYVVNKGKAVPLLLCAASRPRRSDVEPDWPSWVPDWRVPLSHDEYTETYELRGFVSQSLDSLWQRTPDHGTTAYLDTAHQKASTRMPIASGWQIDTVLLGEEHMHHTSDRLHGWLNTATGKRAYGPLHARQGDIICQFGMTALPFIFRVADVDNRTVRLVGGCTPLNRTWEHYNASSLWYEWENKFPGLPAWTPAQFLLSEFRIV